MGIKGAAPSARLLTACANANPASRMARSIGGRSYSTTFFVLVSESICSLLHRLTQRAQIQFWAERRHWMSRAARLQRVLAVQVPKLYGQNKKSRGIMTRQAR